MFLYSLKFICWNLIFFVIVLGGRTFEGWLGPEGEALVNRISAIIKGAPESSLPALWAHKEKRTVYEPERGTGTASAWTLGLPASSIGGSWRLDQAVLGPWAESRVVGVDRGGPSFFAARNPARLPPSALPWAVSREPLLRRWVSRGSRTPVIRAWRDSGACDAIPLRILLVSLPLPAPRF